VQVLCPVLGGFGLLSKFRCRCAATKRSSETFEAVQIMLNGRAQLELDHGILFRRKHYFFKIKTSKNAMRQQMKHVKNEFELAVRGFENN
jgi:hypothetical protein